MIRVLALHYYTTPGILLARERCQSRGHGVGARRLPSRGVPGCKSQPARWRTPWCRRRGRQRSLVRQDRTRPRRDAGLTAASLFNASQTATKCNDMRIVDSGGNEVDRFVQTCTSSVIDIWFRAQASIPGGGADSTTHKLFYGNANAGTPPGSMATVFDPPADSTTSWVLPAKFTGALHFQGGSDGPTVDCGSASAYDLQTFTFELVLKRTGSSWGRLAGHLGGGQNRWLLSLNDNRTVRVTIWACPSCGAQGFDSVTAIDDTTTWHHVAFTLENATLRIYIDGHLDKTASVNSGNIRSGTPPLSSPADVRRFYIGHYAH